MCKFGLCFCEDWIFLSCFYKNSFGICIGDDKYETELNSCGFCIQTPNSIGCCICDKPNSIGCCIVCVVSRNNCKLIIYDDKNNNNDNKNDNDENNENNVAIIK